MPTDLERTQHFTTNFNQICDNLIKYIPKEAQLIEPFVGDGMLLNLFPNNNWECYDLEPKTNAIQRDTLLNPLDYKNKYVITNPPYLARNKAIDKTLFDKYNLDDLYKIAMHTAINAEGGILIIPTNFFSDNNSKDIRKEFLDQFYICELNIFTTPIFESTTYSICAFAFLKQNTPIKEQSVLTHIYPQNTNITLKLYQNYNYRIGGEIFDEINTITPIFTRLQQNREYTGYLTNIYLTGLDTRTELFHLSYNEIPFYGKTTDRIYATLISTYNFTSDEQKLLIETFNKEIKDFRNKYGNLVFTNYRDYNRKRIEFDFVYRYLTKIAQEKKIITAA